jgi:predicted dinucleotide-binding enzyme
VKAFNTLGFNIMADQRLEGGRATMFYSDDDAQAKSGVASLISELGFEALDSGPLTQARLLEPFAL